MVSSGDGGGSVMVGVAAPAVSLAGDVGDGRRRSSAVSREFLALSPVVRNGVYRRLEAAAFGALRRGLPVTTVLYTKGEKVKEGRGTTGYNMGRREGLGSPKTSMI
jgi:hypothetical protein